MNFTNLIPVHESFKDQVCTTHIAMTMRHLFMGSPWALQMIDSSSKIQSGLLEGNVIDLGNFDECININVNEEWGSFIGQHCLLSTKINSQAFRNIPLWWSICLPSTCNATDLLQYLTSEISHIIDVRSETCSIKEAKPFLPAYWIAIFFLCFFGLTCFLSTIYDILTDPGTRKPMFIAFSWYTNGKQLFNTNNDSVNKINCVHGLKFLSAAMIVFGHTYYIGIQLPTVNMKTFKTAFTDWGHIPLYVSLLAVDTFFFLSGLLLCYLFIKNMNQGKKFNIFIFYVTRYIRLTPILAIAILVRTELLIHMGSGPIWNLAMSKEQMYCQKNWWKTLLYIQNYVDYHERCGEETWYLAADMQLYILSPVLLLSLIGRWDWIGFGILQLTTAISILTCFLPIYLNVSINKILDGGKIVIDEYMFTHTRATSWLLGISLSFILHKTKAWQENNLNGFSKIFFVCGWLAMVVCFILPLVYGHKFIQQDYKYDPLEFAIAYTVLRLIWCLGLFWLVFACMCGIGGPVNAILSWKGFQPLSRLSFGIYLFHVPFIFGINFAMRTPNHFGDLNEILKFFGTLVFATILAIPGYLMFEAPTDYIVKTVLKGMI